MEKEIERKIKTSVSVAESLWRAVKVLAARKGLELAQVVEAALKRYIELEAKEIRRELLEEIEELKAELRKIKEEAKELG